MSNNKAIRVTIFMMVFVTSCAAHAALNETDNCPTGSESQVTTQWQLDAMGRPISSTVVHCGGEAGLKRKVESGESCSTVTAGLRW